MTDPTAAPHRSQLESIAAWLSIVAALIHGIVTPGHFEEWWGYGLFFVFLGAFQALFGIAILTNAINAKDFGPRWAVARRWLIVVAIVANIGAIGMWLVTRTVGIPLGPEIGVVEEIGPLDVAAKLAEVGVLVCLVPSLLRRAGIQTT